MQGINLVIVSFVSFLIPECFIVSIDCTDGELPVNEYRSKSRMYWDDESREKLLKIYFETDTGKRGHDKRMKNKWDELHGMTMPQSAHRLYTQASACLKGGEAERLLTKQERQSPNPGLISKQLKWTPEMRENAVKFYYESEPDKWNYTKRLKDIWDRNYPDYPNITAHNLMMRIRDLLKNRGVELNMRMMNLTVEEKIDLVRCHHKAQKYKGEETKIMRELFIKKYPQYSDMNPMKLRHKVTYLRRYHPEIEEKIFGRVSGLDTANSSREPGEKSRTKQGKSISIPTFRNSDFPGASEQYFDPDRDNAWIDRMLQGESLPSPHLFSDLDTRDQTIHSGQLMDQHVSFNAGTSQQNLLDYPGDHFVVPDVGTSYQTIQGHPGNHYVSPDVPTRDKTIHSGLLIDHHVSSDALHQLIHPGNTSERNASLDEGTSYQTIPGYPRNDYISADVGTSHQSIQGHPGEHQAFPNVKTNHQMIHSGKIWTGNAFLDISTSHQTIQGYPRNDYYFPNVGTSQQTFNPGNTLEQNTINRVKVSRQVFHLEQHSLNKKQRKSPKEKVHVLD